MGKMVRAQRKERGGDIITEMWMEKNLNLSTFSLFADIL